MMARHKVMVRAGWWTAIALVVMLFLSVSNLDNEHEKISLETQYNHYSNELGSQIIFNSSSGQTFSEVLSLNGTITNKQGNYSWRIVDLFNLDSNGDPTEIMAGQYLDSITPVSEDTWEWSLFVNISQLNCTCSIELLSTSSDQTVTHSSDLLVYLGEDSHRPFIPYETLGSAKINEFNYTITFELIQSTNQQISVEGISIENIFLESKICQFRSNICVDNWLTYTLDFTYEDNIVVVHVNQNEINVEDGFWMFELFVKDNFLRTSNTVSHVLIIDNKPPQVKLSSSTNIQESESFLVYAEVNDYFVGSPISLTWTVTNPDGDARGLLDEEFYHNSTIELTLNQSGYWDVQLLVRDSANFLVRENITIYVENIKPQIILDLDGLSVYDSDEVFLIPDSSWILNATKSFDTLNDVEGLSFEWFIDGVKVDTSSPVITKTDVSIKSTSSIQLFVYDDNQLSDNITFTVSISQTEDESISVGVVLFSGISLSFVIILLVVKIFIKRESRSFELTKWNSKK